MDKKETKGMINKTFEQLGMEIEMLESLCKTTKKENSELKEKLKKIKAHCASNYKEYFENQELFKFASDIIDIINEKELDDNKESK